MDPQQLFARLRTAASSLSTRQLTTLGLAFVAVLAITLGSAYWLNRPDYRVLMRGLDPADAATVVTTLEAEKVEYQLTDGGSTILVPAATVDQMRLKVASNGMPNSGYPGFEIFDKIAFGVTDFVEKVNYQRALEGEISRTLSSIREVSSAKVHLAVPEKSVFVNLDGDTQEPTASVTLKLRQNQKPDPSTVRAITALVAASVPKLRPERVVVIDDFGRPLSLPPDDDPSGIPMEKQLAIERELTRKTLAILEPIVGAGHVRVNVTARMNTASQESTIENFDPMGAVLRKETTATQVTGGGPGVGGGTAGAQANLPVPAGPAGAATTPAQNQRPLVPGASQSESSDRNFEVSKSVTRTVQPQGQISRINVAVVVDHLHAPPAAGQTGPGKTTPRDPKEMDALRKLVEGSVGFDPMRGDSVTLENVPFDQPVVVPEPELPIWQKYQEQGFEALRILSVLVIAVLAFFTVVRPAIRRALPPPRPTPAPLAAASAVGVVQPRTVQDIERELDAELEARLGNPASKRLPVLTKRATTFTEKEPENAARLIRAWLTEEER